MERLPVDPTRSWRPISKRMISMPRLFYAGLYGGMRNGPFWIEVSLLGGHTDFNSKRVVANNTVAGGLETASAN